MKKVIFAVLLFCVACANAQVKVRFILKEKTAIHHDSIFITGSFSNWDSTSNKNFLLQPLKSNQKSIVLNMKPGEISYKFYRGSWLTVEEEFNGKEINDRSIYINKDTTLIDSVVSWKDQALIDKKYSLDLQLPDSIKIQTLTTIANNYGFLIEYYNRDSALYYAQKALGLLQSMKLSGTSGSMSDAAYSRQLITVQHIIAGLMYSLGNYSKSLELGLENLTIANKLNDMVVIANNLDYIIADYDNMKDYQHVLRYAQQMESVSSIAKGNDTAMLQFYNRDGRHHIAYAYYKLGLLDSALFYARSISNLKLEKKVDYVNYIGLGLLADIYTMKGINDSAIFYYRQALPYFEKNKVIQRIGWLYTGLAKLFKKENRLDSALFYARKALNIFQNNKKEVQASWGDNSESYLTDISPLLAELYKANNQPDSAYKYLLLSVSLKDSLYNSDRILQFQTLTFNEEARRQQLERQRIEAEKEYRTKLKMYGLIAIIAGALIVAFILYRNNQHKQRANNLLLVQKQEIEKTLSELKNTQKQLIQSEKMASLGELTAGIAHEIQNPLNFVNNFCEVNNELIEELKSQKSKLKSEQQDEILNDIFQNNEKINHHGRRADAIVKGMLQHSQQGKGLKESTDINALADEYLRLSYHGMRAKDKELNATIKTEFDEAIGKINIIPQDIGRVLLNLYNNAFYAVSEKKKQQPNGYDPVISVTTKKLNDKVEIRIEDNGNGISQNIADKIFQPFFTTKPTGQGTGLGLSLSYDIIKAHGGEIKVEAKEGEGSEFIIQLPIV